jgi:Holliday junction resolvasome RuvABC endonuclease subunit
MKDILVGIDPSLTNCGIAILWPDKTLELHTADLMAALGWLGSKKITGRMIAVIEDPNKDSTTFGMWAMMKNEIGNMMARRGDMNTVESIFRRTQKRAQDVGKSKGSALLIISMFEKAGVPVLMVAPSSRDNAEKERVKVNAKDVCYLKSPTKTNAEEFRMITGYTGRSNEHNRDAATLIHGRTIVWAETQLRIQKSKSI